MCRLSVTADQGTLVADVLDVTDGGDNKICGHSSESVFVGRWWDTATFPLGGLYDRFRRLALLLPVLKRLF